MLLNQKIHLLLIEDEDYDVRRIRKTLQPFRERITIDKVVADGQSALEIIKKDGQAFDVVIMDYQIVGGISGESLIRKIKEINNALQIIVITKMTINITDFEFANRLMEAGAMWYCTKYPGDIEDFIYQPTDFILSIFNAYEKKRLEEEKLQSSRKLTQSVNEILGQKVIIGESEAVQKMRKRIHKAAQHDTTILISGASGTGKELVATHIHYQSKRRFEKFITINSGSLPNELIESELFGYEKGAFTGARADKPGLFELAHNGTVFLDEIGELPMNAQVKLLRVLQNGEIDKIGRTDKIKVNTRVIAATNKDLQAEIENKHFREDLYYRLNVLTIKVPSLSERRSDIPLLVDFFLERFSIEMSITKPDLSSAALDLLLKYEWPGNVRQLQNVLQRALFMTDDSIGKDEVQEALGSKQIVKSNQQPGWDRNEIIPWRTMERNLKQSYFEFVRTNTTSDAEAARKLGLAPPNYYRMCKELGIK